MSPFVLLIEFCLCWVESSLLTDMATAKSFYDIMVKKLTGEELKLSSLKGKVVLIENVASL